MKIEETKIAIPALIVAMKDDDWAVRKMAILALGELQVTEEIPSIIKSLNYDVESEVRAGASQALGFLKAEQAIPDLIKALDDSASVVQQVTIWTLGMMKEKAKAAVPKMLEILLKPEDVELIQINNLAAWALGEFGDKAAIEPLITAMNAAEYHERKFTIACSLALLEGPNGEGMVELQRMKDNYELVYNEPELLETLEIKLD
ncbi:MAG: HEAT repeat domain-containing protein [Candidatus Heimdallarchaeota archaeon]